MLNFSRSIRQLINLNFFNSRSFFLWSKNTITKRKEIVHLPKASLTFNRYVVINCLNSKIKTLACNLESRRYFSKKKGSKRTIEVEEDSDSEEEDYEESVGDDEMLGDNIIKKNVSSLRLDSVIKAGLGITKKKIEQEFYAFKLRVNGKPAPKKGINVYVGDELDVVHGYSPDTSKFLIVDRIIIKGVEKVTATGQFPVKMEVLKKLIIENYEEPWNPLSVGHLDK